MGWKNILIKISSKFLRIRHHIHPHYNGFLLATSGHELPAVLTGVRASVEAVPATGVPHRSYEEPRIEVEDDQVGGGQAYRECEEYQDRSTVKWLERVENSMNARNVCVNGSM